MSLSLAALTTLDIGISESDVIWWLFPVDMPYSHKLFVFFRISVDVSKVDKVSMRWKQIVDSLVVWSSLIMDKFVRDHTIGCVKYL